jgi:cytochrome c55X
MLLASLIAADARAEIGAARQAELLGLLINDGGSCHGLTLRGGLGPALTPPALAGKASAMLRAAILEGRPGTPMPPWRPFLNDAEAAWLVEQLQSGAVGDAR